MPFQPSGDRQSFFAQERRIEQLRLIAGAIVAQDGNDGVPGSERLGEADRAGNVDARRTAKNQSLMLGEVEDDFQRLGVGDLVRGVDGRLPGWR